MTATTVVTLTATRNRQQRNYRRRPAAQRHAPGYSDSNADEDTDADANPVPLPEDGDALPQNIGDLAVSMSVSGVASSYAWTVAPWVTYDDSAEPVTAGIPAHIVVSYGGDDAAEALAAGQRFIIPVACIRRSGMTTVTALCRIRWLC